MLDALFSHLHFGHSLYTLQRSGISLVGHFTINGNLAVLQDDRRDRCWVPCIHCCCKSA